MNKRKGAKERKTLRIYQITKQQAENTEYRPLDVEIEEIETEDGWNYADVIENDGDGYQAEKITETRDGLIVWRVFKEYEYTDGTTETEAEFFYVELPTQRTTKYVLVYFNDCEIIKEGVYDSPSAAREKMLSHFFKQISQQRLENHFSNQIEEIKRCGTFTDFDIGVLKDEAYLLYEDNFVWKIIEV